ncbi:hypothetical protein FRC12_007130 [Ceratobasidium sp. 428]|nr:hypothetical protein FRC12_007130 [Ceratobasidium sp. 428]
MSSSRKPADADADADCLAANRPRRQNAGVARPRADGTVYDSTAARTKLAEKSAKTSAAAEIEADQFTGDDSVAREPLLEFIPPSETGDDEVDRARFEEARIDFLIRFIAIRDAADLRPLVESGTLDLAGLEEIYADEEAAAEYLADGTELDTMPASSSKGKLKEVTTSSTANRAQEQTGYAGITLDSQSQNVIAKHAPKSASNQSASVPAKKRPAEQDTTARKIQRAAPPDNSESNSSTTRPTYPLRRSDSTTVLDGKRVKQSVFYHPRQFRPGPSPTSKDASPTPGKPTRQVPSAQRPSTSSHGSKGAVPFSGQPTPTLARANNIQTPRANRQSQSGPAQLHRPSAAAAAPGPSHPTTARDGLNMLRQKGHTEKPAPTQVAHPQAQEPHEDEEPIEDNNVEGEIEPEEEEAPSEGKGTKPRGLGKAYVKSFPEDEQERIQAMVRLSKARQLANGTYDETESTLTQPYELEWPKCWKARKTRIQIVSESLKDACKECYAAELPFRLRHVQAALIGVTTMRNSALKEVKHVVDLHFGFAPREKCDWNKDMAESLLPLNFVYSHVKRQEHPFENQILVSACQAVAFGKECAIGARYREELKGIPPGFLAFVCVMIKVVIGGYLTGEWTDPKLNADVQTAAFRQCLEFLMKTHYNKPNQMTSIRTEMWDACVANLEPKDRVRAPTPIPEREWTPDVEEVYISQYDPTVNQDVDMDG